MTRIKWSYVSTLPEGGVRISHDDSTMEELLDSLCANSNIKDENGKVVSLITEIYYEVIK